MARTIQGRITNHATNAPISGARVEAYDEDPGSDQLMGADYTDNNGYYKIRYRGGHWDWSLGHGHTIWRPDIYIKVYLKEEDQWYQAYPKSPVHRNHKLRRDLTINLKVDDQRRLIEGRFVHKRSGSLASNLVVRAMDRDDFNKNDFMGETQTDAQGRYRIRYRGGHWDWSPSHGVTTWRPDIYIVAFVEARDGLLSRCFRSDVHEDWRLRDKLTVDGQVEENDWHEKMTAFRPDTHGWPFDNDPRTVCAAPTCKEEYAHPLFRQFLRFKWTLCGGMSLSAVRRFNREQAVEPFSPTVKEELVTAQVDTLIPRPPDHPGNWYTFVEWQARPDFPHVVALHTIGYETKKQWHGLRAYLDQGKPRVLGLIRVGPTNNPADAFDNHQVLAIGYRMNKLTNEVEIKVYDPNYPGKTATIHFNTGLLQNQINSVQTTPGASEERVRGFFLVDVPHG